MPSPSLFAQHASTSPLDWATCWRSTNQPFCNYPKLFVVGSLFAQDKNFCTWQGKPISTVKTFKNLNCSLCTRERLEIYKAMKLDKKNNTNFLINTLNELCGGCRHIPRFHRFCHICPKRADEAKAEKLENG